MAEKRKPKQEQIKRLSIQIAKKVSTKRNTIQTLNYLYHKKHLTGFINFCLGELTIIKTKGENLDSATIILKYRLKDIPIIDTKHHIHKITNLVVNKKNTKFTYKQISDFLMSFVCEMMME